MIKVALTAAALQVNIAQLRRLLQSILDLLARPIAGLQYLGPVSGQVKVTKNSEILDNH